MIDYPDGSQAAEYDVVAINGYRLVHFELKRVGEAGRPGSSGHRRKMRERFRQDIHKRYQTRQRFGGPFGIAVWSKTAWDPFEEFPGLRNELDALGVIYLTGPELGLEKPVLERLGLPSG